MFGTPQYIKFRQDLQNKLDSSEDLPRELSANTPIFKKRKRRVYSKHPNYSIAMEQAGYKCEECGSTFAIGIHHIDGNHENHELPNLKVLCWNPCHISKHWNKSQ